MGNVKIAENCIRSLHRCTLNCVNFHKIQMENVKIEMVERFCNSFYFRFQVEIAEITANSKFLLKNISTCMRVACNPIHRLAVHVDMR